MNRTMMFATALAAGLATSTLAAQAPAAAAPAAAPASVPPQAVPAKVAIIAFEQAVVSCNEGQKTLADIQKKYEPQKKRLDDLGAEIDSLKKQLQALPATTPDDERAKRIKDIDTKEKQYQRDGEDASNAFNGEVQEALGKIAQKIGTTAAKYVKDNGFTILLNYANNQQEPSPILWFDQTTDITDAVVNAYNTVSGVAAPPPSAPTPHRTTPTGGSTTAPKKQ
jgi:Skp family chaperone for outer membrane proteins